MKIKLLHAVLHDGHRVEAGETGDIDEATAMALIASGAAEEVVEPKTEPKPAGGEADNAFMDAKAADTTAAASGTAETKTGTTGNGTTQADTEPAATDTPTDDTATVEAGKAKAKTGGK
jgi:hypothetical protein